MNPTLEYIYNHPKETKRIIGITYEQLIKLIAKAQIIESEKKEAIAKTEKRLIKAGGVRKKNLTKEEEIILTLFYLHQIPTFQTLGINFGISESSANNIFHYWIDILRELLPASLLEQVKKKENELEWVKEILTELELIVDSTEQRIFVEHVIRLIKIFGIARERFRLKDNNYQKVILTICGLVRLRIGSFILV